MKTASLFVVASTLALAGCEGAKDADTLHAEIWVIPMKWYLDDAETQVAWSVEQDGSVNAGGKTVARIVGQEIRSPSGAVLVKVLPDDTVISPSLPAGAHFERKGLVWDHGRVTTVVPSGTKSLARAGWASDFGRMKVGVVWEGGKTAVVKGHAYTFQARAYRELLLLTAALVLKPEELAGPAR